MSPETPRLDPAPWLTAASAQAVFACLEAAGFEVRVVGGAVRNALLSTPVSDVDLATTAHPDTVIALAIKAGMGAHPTGIAHGTVTVVSDHVAYEVTTLRKDVETHGRRAVVAFTHDWAEDAMRRDFTLNAIYCDRTGRLYDPLGGLPDLSARRIVFIGSARARIQEDYLRILRFFRFHATYAAGAADPGALAAIRDERHGLSLLSAERVRAELLKLLITPRVVEAVADMAATGVFSAIFGMEISPQRSQAFARLVELGNRAETLGLPGSPWLLRFAMLADLEGSGAEQLAKRFRLSSQEKARLEALRHVLDLPPGEVGCPSKRIVYRRGLQVFADAAMWAWAQTGHASDPSGDGVIQDLGAAMSWPVPVLPISGADVIALGVQPGLRVGHVLRVVEDWWVALGFAPDADEVKAKLAATVRALQDGKGRD